MIVKEIVNHTPYTLGFVYDGIEITLGSRGVFNINHAYDRDEDEGTLRIVDNPTTIELSKKMNIPNFISLSDLLSGNALQNVTDVEISFFLITGLGKYEYVINSISCCGYGAGRSSASLWLVSEHEGDADKNLSTSSNILEEIYFANKVNKGVEDEHL